MNERRLAVLVSDHDWDLSSPDRTGFDWLALALAEAGRAVAFVHIGPKRYADDPALTAKVSRSIAPGEVRGLTLKRPRLRRLQGDRFLELIAAATGGKFLPTLPGAAKALVSDAGIVIFDSGWPLLFVEPFRALNRHARFVYRMSDPLETLILPPRVHEAERRVLGRFALVSVPSAAMYDRFRELPHVRLQPHGVDAAALDVPAASPYAAGSKNAVFTGMHGLELDFVARGARLRPGVTFHLLGPWTGMFNGFPNVVAHGTMPFGATVPYLRHADIGLHCLQPRGQFDAAFSDTQKVKQYAYCGLPIVAPSSVSAPGAEVFVYERGDDRSIAAALDAALAFDRSAHTPAPTRTWADLAAELAGER